MFNQDSHFKPVCTDEYTLRKTNWQKEKNEAKTTPSQKKWSCCGSNGFLLPSTSSCVRALCNFSLQALLIYPFKLTFWLSPLQILTLVVLLTHIYCVVGYKTNPKGSQHYWGVTEYTFSYCSLPVTMLKILDECHNYFLKEHVTQSKFIVNM